MSSWLSLSLPNPFKSSDDQPPLSPDHSPPTPAGVKDDFSVLGQTIGRQLRGVAAFLAPPPSPPPPPQPADDESSPSRTLLGIKNDLVEIGGSFKSSLSLLSSNKAVTEISKFATNFLQFEEEAGEDREEAVGITDEVLDFVREISSRPECWTDFPLSLHNDFNMSESQREHTASVEHYVLDLETLRHKICSELMSEEQFWMIYFILLLPRLDENDATLLSTPEIVEVREMLLQKLRNNKNAPVKIPNESESIVTNHENINAPQRTKSPPPLTEVPAEGLETSNQDNTDQWLEEEDIATSPSVDPRKPPQNEEEVSFSDLEDEEDDSDRLSGRLSGFRSDEGNKVTSGSESNEWVRLGETSLTVGDRRKVAVGPPSSREKDSEGEESNDWLTVDDVDF